jgi:hypothetical protein
MEIFTNDRMLNVKPFGRPCPDLPDQGTVSFLVEDHHYSSNRRETAMKITASVVLILIVGLFAWTSRRQLINAASGMLPASGKSPRGEWVGEINIVGGYLPSRMGDTPGPHKKAAMHFNLSITDSFMDEYGGPGELFIEGETKPRTIKMDLRLHDDGRVKMVMLGDSGLADNFGGQFTSTEIRFEQPDPDPGSLMFNGVVHRGTYADYQAMCRDYQKSAP